MSAGKAFTLIEVLHVWMEIGEIASTGLLATRLGAWLLARRRAETESTDQPRPRSADLYGPDGELLKTVRVEGDEPDIGGPEVDKERFAPVTETTVARLNASELAPFFAAFRLRRTWRDSALEPASWFD